MTNAIITREEMEALSPESLVGQVLALEAEAEGHSTTARALNERAKEIRQMIVDKLKAAGLTSATHESGNRATIRTTVGIAIKDEALALKSIKKAKLGLFLTQVARRIIPAHEIINLDLLKNWIKTGTPAQRQLLDGVEVAEKETLVIARK